MLFSERNIYNEKPLMLNDISDNCKGLTDTLVTC